MAKFKVRTYLSTFVDVEVEALTETEAIEQVENDSDIWFANAEQLKNNMACQEGMSEVY